MPGQLARKAMVAEVERALRQMQPAVRQASAFGHEPQQIMADEFAELPVGIGSFLLNQAHEMAFRAGMCRNQLRRAWKGFPQS